MLFPTVSKDPLCLKEERHPESHHSTAWGHARWGWGWGAPLPRARPPGNARSCPGREGRGRRGQGTERPPSPPSVHHGGTREGAPFLVLGDSWAPEESGTTPSRETLPVGGANSHISPLQPVPPLGAAGQASHRPSGTTVRTPLPNLQTRTPRVRAAPRTEGSPPRAPWKCHHPPPQRTRPRLRGTRCPRSLSCKGPSGHPDQAQEGCPHRATQPARGFPRLPGGAPLGRCPLATPPLQGVEIPSSSRRRCPPPASATGFGFLASDEGTPHGLGTNRPAAVGTSWAGPSTSLSPEGRPPRAGQQSPRKPAEPASAQRARSEVRPVLPWGPATGPSGQNPRPTSWVRALLPKPTQEAHPAPLEWQRVPGTSGLNRSEPGLNQLLGTCVTANGWRGGHGAGPPGHRTGRGWAPVSSVHPRSRPFLTTPPCILRRPQHTGVSPRLAGPSLTWTLQGW